MKKRTLIRLLSSIRIASVVILIIAFAIFIIGGVMGKKMTALIGWILWALFAFVPVVIIGIETTLNLEVIFRPLILLGPRIKLEGTRARWFGIILSFIGSLGIMAGFSMVFILISVLSLENTP